MPADPDSTWLKTAANDLNNLLHVIAESAHLLEPFCTENPEARRYFDFLRTSLDRTIAVTAEMTARLGGQFPPIPAPGATATPDSAPVINPAGQRELIMIVDDEEIVRRLVTAILTRADYRVLAPETSLHALDFFKIHHASIHLVILDFTMPIMDGAELFDEMHRIDPAATIMLSSGFAEQSKVGAMLARGLRGFLPKPFTEGKLLEQVRSTLDTIRAERTGQRRVL